jgi:D-lyxose ketol-isomerase
MTAQRQAAEMIRRAGMTMTDAEADSIEVVDFGLSNLEKEGVQVLTLVQTDRISVKVLAMLPNQTEPEHWHPPVSDDPGKEETIRVIAGTVYFYVAGEDTFKEGFIVAGKDDCYTMGREIVMKPGDQLTLAAGEKHWFQAREDGAVMYSFSTIARDALDQFTDPGIVHESMQDFSLLAVALGMGAAAVRVGFEDSVYFAPGEAAKTNAELVERIVSLIRLIGYEVAAPEEARKLLRLKS